MINISLLFIITDEGHDKKVKSILNSFGIKVKTVSNANGTASPSVLDYFGLIERKKAVFMAIIPNYLSKDILNKLNNHFKFDDVGTGVSFTVPISSSNKYLSDVFKNNAPESEEKHMEQENSIKYHLVITIVSEGYLEQVMTAAKRAGSSLFSVVTSSVSTNSVSITSSAIISSFSATASITSSATSTVSAILASVRSEERRVGKECPRVCISRWSPYH